MLHEIAPNDLNIGEKRTLVYFYTPFCGTCREARRMLALALEALPEKPPAYSCNLNLAAELAQKWQIESVPCLLVFNGGKIEKRIYAFRSTSFLFDELGRKM